MVPAVSILLQNCQKVSNKTWILLLPFLMVFGVFLPFLMVSGVFMNTVHFASIKPTMNKTTNSQQNQDIAFTFSNGVWSVHLASSDRDGVLRQCVRQRSVVTLALRIQIRLDICPRICPHNCPYICTAHRNNISNLFPYLSPYLPCT